MRSRFLYSLAAFAIVMAAATPVGAQTLGQRLKEKTKEKVAQRAEDRADKAIDKALDKTECLITDKDCIKKAKAAGKQVAYKDADGNAVDEKGKRLPASASATATNAPSANASTAGKAVAAGDAPAAGPAWSNFDFVPGNQVLFSDDFARDRVGNFPQRLELVAGNIEIVDWQSRRWVRATAEGSRFDVPLPKVLPPRFTLEFDIIVNERRGIYQSVHAAAANDPAEAFTSLDGGEIGEDATTSAIFINQHEAGLGGGRAPTAKKAYAGASSADDDAASNKVFRVRLQADARYLKVYVNADRVANVPNGNFGRTNKLRFQLNATAEEPVFVGNITVAAGGSGFYDALLADGRVATQGILFSTGSDQIRPESNATLKQIGDMLRDHADLKLMIEGHTDNVGVTASNKSLSERRAAAVKQYLVANFGIAPTRLSSSGFGDSKPAAPNTTPEGRQQNRRVELVKI